MVTVATNAPLGLFSASGSGMRDGAILNAVTFQGGGFNIQTGDSPTYMALFGTGISLSTAPTVTVNGVSAQVLFYGAAPCCEGVEQINVLLPTTLAGAGRVPVALTSSGQMSNMVEVVVLPPGGNGNGTRSRELSTIAYVPGGSLVLVADENDDVVRIVDVSAQKVTQVITLPEGANPRGIAVNSSGTEAVVAETGLGSVAVLDLTKDTVTTAIATGLAPVSVAIAGTQAVVSNQDADTLSVIDLTSNAVQKTINVGHGPTSVAVDTTVKQAYVVNEADGTLSVIDLAGLTMTKSLPLGEATRGENIAVIPGAGVAFVAVPAAGPNGEVLVVNLSSGAVTSFSANPDGSGGSTSLVYFNSKLYLSNQGGGSISIVPVSATTGAPTAAATTVKVDLGPRALAIDTKDNLLVVTNEGAGTLVLVNLANNQIAGRISGVDTGLDGDDDKDDHSDRGNAANRPMVKSLSPQSAKLGSTFTLTIGGKNFNGATRVVFELSAQDDDGPGKLNAAQPDTTITSTNLAVSTDGTQLTAMVTIAASAAPGTRNVRVVTPNGESRPDNPEHTVFTVTQ
jgi:YVTN family beta-propeller protein